MFETILLNHGIKIVKTINNNTFEVIDDYVKNGIAYEETKTVYFGSIAELLIWLGY